MAARTETRRVDGLLGNLRFVKGEFADIDDADTWDPGLAIVEWVTVQNRTANPATTEVNATITNGTAGGANQARVTFDTEGNNLSLVAVAYGN